MSERLRLAGQAQGGATLYSVLLAGLASLLARYAGQPDVCIGTVVSGRRGLGDGVERLVGCFINPLVRST